MLRILLPRETFDGSVFCFEPPILLNTLERETCLCCAPVLRGNQRERDGVSRDQLRDWNHPNLTPGAPQLPQWALLFLFPQTGTTTTGTLCNLLHHLHPAISAAWEAGQFVRNRMAAVLLWNKPDHFQNGIKALQKVLLLFGAMLLHKALWILKCSGYMGMC